MHDPVLRHSYVQINNSLVHLLQYGSGDRLIRTPIHDSLNLTKSSSSTRSIGSDNVTINGDNNNTSDAAVFTAPKKLIIFIPGNPGVLGMYHDFLVSLFRMISSSSSKKHNDDATILAIGHNNFDHPDYTHFKTDERICVDEKDLNFVERAIGEKYDGEPHHIELQVLNKLIILKRLLNIDIKSCKIMFIGHSVGCYIILKLLQDKTINSTHEGSVLIHPALENLALTEKGSFFSRAFTFKLDILMQYVAYILDNLLPKSVKLTITKWFCPAEFVQTSSDIVLESVQQLVCQKTLCALIQMAKSELALVRNMNSELLIKPYANKLKLIYAINDHWVNADNRRLLKDSYPELYIEEQSTLHAFIMEPQTVMDYAVKVGMFIQDFIDNIDQNQSGEIGNGNIIY